MQSRPGWSLWLWKSVIRSGFHRDDADVEALYEDLTDAASFFEPGQIIEYRENYFSVRAIPDAN